MRVVLTSSQTWNDFSFSFAGFHLSATVHQPHGICQSKGTFNVAVTFDRGRITSCNCSCDQTVTWCSHVISLCLFRIHFPNMVCLRAPVSEYLSRLKRDQLQKFAQYLISELPQQVRKNVVFWLLDLFIWRGVLSIQPKIPVISGSGSKWNRNFPQ